MFQDVNYVELYKFGFLDTPLTLTNLVSGLTVKLYVIVTIHAGGQSC